MSRPACLLATVLLLAGQAAAWPQDKPPVPRKKLPDGVYAVRRDSLKEKSVLPLGDGPVLGPTLAGLPAEGRRALESTHW